MALFCWARLSEIINYVLWSNLVIFGNYFFYVRVAYLGFNICTSLIDGLYFKI
uniref:Uncharacterized protein n=1 Tax=Oryza brachyantha TaxID=4533 RepID=J3M6H3_ORYBR